ncbi:serine/threonine-protein kinase [Nocardia sp. CA-107356]|uniref:serine/threonine-protein kinase n=1 Tax=Nocardia sp. CA-107356 TaxID=3239972 RepID=UPI003D8AF4FE
MVARLEPGDPVHVGRYRLLGQLGAGGMGRVLLGIGPDGRLVAIKQVHTHLATEEDFLPRFRREVQTSARVSGAFTAALIDFDVDSKNPWLASVFVPGVPLDKAVHDFGPLSTDQVRALAVGLAAALQAIHGVGLIHRDLKPANVILAEDGPRVIDFGIARATEERSELTHTGSIIGSPAFMSPEQARSEPLTPASDVFSFGAVLAMAATSKSPFAGSSLPHTLYNIVHTQPDLSRLPPEVRQLVEPCLRKDPSARPTPAQILDFLGPLPPQARPWSAAIHNAVHEQDAELSALLADPEATQIVGADDTTVPGPQGRSFDEKLRQLEAGSRSDPPKRRWVLVAALVGVVILVGAAVAGAVTLTGGDPTPDVPNPLAGFNTTKLRSIDVCAAMKDPLVASLGKWERGPISLSWGTCSADAGGESFDVDIKRTEGFRDSGRKIGGVPVLENPAAGGKSCERALLPAAAETQFGIVVQVTHSLIASGSMPTDKLCQFADEGVAQVARNLIAKVPQLPNFHNSLARHDPCAVIDSITVKTSIGEQVRGTPDLLHTCKWFSASTVTVNLWRDFPSVDPKPIHFDFGGGNVVDVNEAEMRSTSCVRQGVYQPSSDGKAELISVLVDGPTVGDHPEFRCHSAVRIVQNILENLPKASR